MAGTQTAPVVVGVTRPGGLFPKDQAGGGGHTVQSVWRAGRPLVAPCHMGPGAGGGHRKLCTHVLRIPLVSSQGNKEVPAVAGKETPAGAMKMKGPVAPSSSAAVQVAAEGLLALASPP